VLVDILLDLIDVLADEDVYVSKVAPSPFPGRKGNREFFFLLRGKEEKPIRQIKAECRTSALK
jgi:hypothetical protein